MVLVAVDPTLLPRLQYEDREPEVLDEGIGVQVPAQPMAMLPSLLLLVVTKRPVLVS
jgi:hypothetical protein